MNVAPWWLAAAAVEEAPRFLLTPLSWKHVLIGGLVAGLVRYIWSALCWMVFKHHNDDWQAVPDAEALEAALAKADLKPGYFYALPHMNEYEGGQRNPALRERMEKGPNATLVPMPKGWCMTGGMFGRGFLFNVLEGIILAFLTLVFWDNYALPIDSLVETMAACAVVGLLISIAAHWQSSNWMLFPWRHTWSMTFDTVVGFALMGATLWVLANYAGLIG